MPLLLQIEARVGKAIRRGNDHYWAVMREIGSGGVPFGVPDIVRRSMAADRSSIRTFMRRLQLAGYVEAKSPGLFVLLRRPVATPRLSADGSASGTGRGQELMWWAMQSMPSFTAEQLAVTASIEECMIAVSTATSYCQKLKSAGYLTAVEPGRPHRPTVYRLKPSMNTGEKPPLILRTKLVYDQNRGEIVGGALAEEEPA